MRSVVTRVYDLDQDQVFLEITSVLVDLGFDLEAVWKKKRIIEGTRGEAEFHPSEMVHVRVWKKNDVTFVETDLQPPREARAAQSIYDSLDERIGAHTLPGDPKAPIQEVAGEEGRTRPIRLEDRSVMWAYVPTTLNLMLALVASLGILAMDEFFYVVVGPVIICLLTGLILMGVGLPRAGAVLAIIGGVLSFPAGTLGLLGGVWAWVLADKMRRRGSQVY
jgi:hypothetical protein